MSRLFTALLSILCLSAFAEPGDTTIVQTYTFEDQNNPNSAYDYPGRRTFNFPEDDGTTYQKVVMYHTLKCFEDGTAGNLGFACGEWDYLTYNYLFKHTGEFDSTLTNYPHFLWDNTNFESAYYTTEQTFDSFQYEQQFLVIDNFGEENSFPLLNGSINTNNIFGGGRTGRSQYIWTSTELTAAGLSAGSINAINLPALESGSYENFTIRMKSGNSSNLLAWSELNWIEVYNQNTFIEIGDNVLYFTNPFEWSGNNNIFIEFSYTNSTAIDPILTAGDETQSNFGFALFEEMFSGEFNNHDQIIAHNSWYAALENEVTIAFWLNGAPAIQPANGSCFEGINANNERILNAHAPWSNGRVYWDAGYFYGYDRIDKLAAESQYESNWNHYAFTKNAATGIMKIVVNGTTWHSGSGLDNVFEEMVRFVIGSGANSNNFYQGQMDDFIILNKALTNDEINELRNVGLQITSGFTENILLYHSFTNDDSQFEDSWNSDYESIFLGSVKRRQLKGSELHSGGFQTFWRPNISLIQHTHETHVASNLLVRTEARPLTSLVEYGIVNYTPIAFDYSYFYPAGYTYTYAPDGSKLDSTWIASTVEIINDQLDYYQAPYEITERYELGRYITPYGINLTLGDGWTWVFDVTDFEPLLHGEVDLEAGNWQELLDLKFVFIEGPEAREVTKIENLWNGNFNINNFDNVVTERLVGIGSEDGEAGLKLRTTVTGHGFGFDNNNCGEFCFNTHSVNVNGTPQWSWEIMQDCDKNPLYPQGGTWIYARAGWCPGMEGKTNEFELTNFLQNDSVNVDYNITYDPFGNYVTESQLIHYGPILQTHDAEIMDINAPSTWKIKSRINPICDEPRIVLRNRGSQPLTNVTITYFVEGGATQQYQWTGNLLFDEYEEVVLSYDDPILWQNDEVTPGRFIVDLESDDNLANNHAELSFNRPPVLTYNNTDDNRMIIILRTNSAYQETSYALYDINDNIIFQRNNFDAPNTTYRDTIQLNQGCYKFHLMDSDGDGLSFFANDDGSGQCRLDRVGASDFKIFNADFGKEVIYYFFFQTNLVSVEEYSIAQSVPLAYPNPASESIHLRFSDMIGNFEISISDAVGRKVYSTSWNKTQPQQELEMPINSFVNGLYFITVSDNEHVYSLKVLKQ